MSGKNKNPWGWFKLFSSSGDKKDDRIIIELWQGMTYHAKHAAIREKLYETGCDLE